MQKRTPVTRTEPLQPILATSNELVAVCAAITTYRKWISSTPQSAEKNQDTITLLDRFQKRLTQLPPSLPLPQEVCHERD